MDDLARLGLGTVQWGLHYGVSNSQGKTPSGAVSAILAAARNTGVRVLDTASLYGDSESILGMNDLTGFRVVTKTPRFATSGITPEDCTRLQQVFSESLEKLSCEKVYGLLSHHADDLLAPGGEKLWDVMLELKSLGLVEKIGVSVYDGNQVKALLKILKPDLVQLPINVLDQRLMKDGSLAALKDVGVEIHARSAFLQGLLLMPHSQVPGYFDPIRPLLQRWHTAAENQGMTLVQAALSFVRGISHVDTVLVGVESLVQFQACCEDFVHPTVFDASGLACDESAFINPSQWKLQ